MNQRTGGFLRVAALCLVAFLAGGALAWAVKPARTATPEPLNEARINQCERWAVIGPAGKFAAECTKAEQDFVMRYLEATRD